MIQTELEPLMSEIRDAKKRLEPHLNSRGEILRHTAGRHYKPDGIKGTATPENYPYAFKSFVRPQLLFGRPTCKVMAKTPLLDDVAQALEVAVNYWTKETEFKSILGEVIDDSFAGFGMTMCGVSIDPYYHGNGQPSVYGDFEQRPSYPFCVRIDPKNAILDARAQCLREGRIVGHTYEQDIEDVLADQRNDPGAAEKLQAAAHERGVNTGATFPESSREGERKRISIHEVYLREHGLMVAIADLGTGDAGSGVILRQEQYFGPDEGPFTLWGLDTVAGELIPLSPLVALWDEFLEVSEHTRAAALSAATHKKIGVYEPAAENDAKRINNAKPGTMVPVKDIKSVADFEIGGASQAQIGWIEFVRGRLEHNLGYGAAQAGIAEGNKTATGEQIASQNSDLRIDRMRDSVADSISSVFRKIAWYFQNDSTIRELNVQTEDPMTGQMVPTRVIPGPWQGGIVDGLEIPPEPPSEDTDYEFTIDPDSMVKTDNAVEQKRAQDEVALVKELALIFGPQVIDWRRVIDRYGDKMGVQGLSDIIFVDQAMLMLPTDPMMQSPMGPKPGAVGAQRQQGAFPGSMGQAGSPTPQPQGFGQLPAMLGAAQRVA